MNSRGPTAPVEPGEGVRSEGVRGGRGGACLVEP